MGCSLYIYKFFRWITESLVLMLMLLNQGNNLSYKQMQYNYSKKMFARRDKPIQIIGNPTNHCLNKWIKERNV